MADHQPDLELVKVIMHRITAMIDDLKKIPGLKIKVENAEIYIEVESKDEQESGHANG